MKRSMFSFLIVFVIFVLFTGFTPGEKMKDDLAVTNYASLLLWHTFLGGSSYEAGSAIAIDSSGNIYVAGTGGPWGSPVNPFAGYYDAFVAKLNPSGVLQWNTFLGGKGIDDCIAIALDGSGNIYVTGGSTATWGNPVNPFGGGESDAFVAKLNQNGVRQWNTFLGGDDEDYGYGIVTYGSGNIYVTGGSTTTWGSPFNPFIGGESDAFVAQLNSNGVCQWNTFLGGDEDDEGWGMAIDKSGDVYVTGYSCTTWGSPVNPYGGWYYDAFVAKVNSNGVRQWHTFLGGDGDDFGWGIVLDRRGNICVTGRSDVTWGSPVRPFAGSSDAFVAKLNSSGVRQWNTFLGESDWDMGCGIVTDVIGNIYVTGRSATTWGRPLNPHAGGDDAFVARLNSDGAWQWNTFLGGGEDDYGSGIGMYGSDNIYVSGGSSATWGSPVNPFDSWNDAFVARITDINSLPPYQITLNRENLYFGSTGNESTGTQAFLVSSDSSLPGSIVPRWAASSDQTWLSCTPANSIGPGLVTVSVNPTGLSVGTYTGIITVTDPIAVNSPQTLHVTFSVYGAGQATEPFGQYSTPTDGSLVSGSVPFTGWALDDIGVESVKIYLQDGSTSIYIGDAVFIEGARPDVEQAYPGYPMNYRAGWGYMMLTNFLPNSGNGFFTIAAVATDREGNQVTLGTKTITVDNANAVKPFGAIDTPTQGGTASGNNYRNWGWVLTPPPNLVPTNGTTIDVWVDGVNVGHPTYNMYRSDVASLFPGYGNANGAGGYFDIDTTAYDNGVHSIFWTATDNGGNTDGIGSRYFSILNTGSSRISAVSWVSATNPGRTAAPGYKDIIAVPLSYDDPVKLKKGYTDSSLAEEVSPEADGIVLIRCRELERIELQVSQAGNPVEGYLVVGQRLKRLPIGSTLDSKTGMFNWIPGPGFVGTYRLVFVETDKKGEQSRKEIRITIEPKSFRE